MPIAPKFQGLENWEPTSTLYFSVEVDGLDLGTWTTCEGLTAEFEVESLKEGGNGGYEHKLFSRVKYANIKLTRAISHESAGLVPAWFSAFNKIKAARQHATIKVYDIAGKPIVRYVLDDVHPLKWSGPNLTAKSPDIAMETLEMAHHGFMVEAS